MTENVATPVDYELDAGIARITLNDPQRGNAINATLLAALLVAVRRAGADSARVILLRSTGRWFSVGGDVEAFGTVDDVGSFVDDLAETIHRVVSELVRSPAVVVASVQGTAAGASFPLVAGADVVVAARSAQFVLGYTKLGFSVDGGTSLLVHTLGLHRVLRLALLNDVVSAEEALAAGLVARVVEDADLATETDKIASRLAAGPARAQAATKALVRAAAEASPESVMKAEALSIRERVVEPDGVEGVRAFREKRSPEFTDQR